MPDMDAYLSLRYIARAQASIGLPGMEYQYGDEDQIQDHGHNIGQIAS